MSRIPSLTTHSTAPIAVLLASMALWQCQRQEQAAPARETGRQGGMSSGFGDEALPKDRAERGSSEPGASGDPVPAGGNRYAAAMAGFQHVFADVAEKAIPAVVSVHSEKETPSEPMFELGPDGTPFHWFFGPDGQRRGNRRESGLGSGVLISKDGYVLTNNHVIEGADVIRVTLSDDRELSAKLVGADKASDLAVLKISDAEKEGPFSTMPMGDSDKMRIGEWILAVGSPYGLSQTVTAGIISAKGRSNTGINSYENFLQTDAAINPGNSGGALMNMQGELIGINTAIFSRSGGYQGIGFAIPINMARVIMEDLIRDGEVTRGWLGVSIQPIDQGLAEALGLRENKGALVGGVIDGSPADKAGIKRGDVILKLDGQALRDHSDLLNRIAMIRPGNWITLIVHRGGKELSFKTKVQKRDEKRLSRMSDNAPEGPAAEALGLTVAPVSQLMKERYNIDKSAERGVVVTEVDKGGRAARGKVREGDVIVELNRRRITDPLQFDDLLRNALRGNRVLLLVSRGGETFYTTL
jgi:serine protease Do